MNLTVLVRNVPLAGMAWHRRGAAIKFRQPLTPLHSRSAQASCLSSHAAVARCGRYVQACACGTPTSRNTHSQPVPALLQWLFGGQGQESSSGTITLDANAAQAVFGKVGAWAGQQACAGSGMPRAQHCSLHCLAQPVALASASAARACRSTPPPPAPAADPLHQVLPQRLHRQHHERAGGIRRGAAAGGLLLRLVHRRHPGPQMSVCRACRLSIF